MRCDVLVEAIDPLPLLTSGEACIAATLLDTVYCDRCGVDSRITGCLVTCDTCTNCKEEERQEELVAKYDAV